MRRASSYLMALLLGAVLGIAGYLWLPELITTSSGESPVNMIVIDDRLVTSGQPTPEQLNGLVNAGYELVINLAPPTSLASVPDEGGRLGAAGITYINIPVKFSAPRERDFLQFVELLDDNRDRKVLVHCQLNKRASVFTFLYRVTRLHIDPDEAIEQVYAVWSPAEVWPDFMTRILHRHGIDYLF